MCQYFSAIVIKDEVLWDANNDSHEDIIAMHKLDDTTKEPNFVRLEVSGGKMTNVNDPAWKIKVDQDYLPNWWKLDKYHNMIMGAFRTCHQQIVKTEGHHIVKQGRVCAYNSATVKACDSAIVEAYNSATVEACNSAIVKAYDSATVKAFNSATVKAYNSATVIKWSGDVKIQLYDNAVLVDRSGEKPKCQIAKNAKK